MNIDQASDHVGATVLYRPNPSIIVQGVIESVNASYVFVRYGSDSTTKATTPDLLELAPMGIRPGNSGATVFIQEFVPSKPEGNSTIWLGRD